MGKSIPNPDQYQGDADFEDVRIGMSDRSTYVFGRVSAAIRFARRHEANVVDFTIGTSKPYQTWPRLKRAKPPRAPRERRFYSSDAAAAAARRKLKF